MSLINKKELKQISGGLNINGTMINALMKGINTILDLGRTFGSAIVRVINGGYCPV